MKWEIKDQYRNDMSIEVWEKVRNPGEFLVRQLPMDEKEKDDDKVLFSSDLWSLIVDLLRMNTSSV